MDIGQGSRIYLRLFHLCYNNCSILKSQAEIRLFNLTSVTHSHFLFSIGKLSISKALDLTLYLNHESQIMPVFQGMNELIPIYKLMEKRDMDDVENQLKVS